MRLKISTVHPLNTFKAWFSLDTLADDVYTIAHLKRTLCARLPIVLPDYDNIMLMMDEYDLLNDSPISILRDGDAVCIKLIPATFQAELPTDKLTSSVTLKRKRCASTPSESSSSSCSSSSSSSSSDSSADSSRLTSPTDSDSDSDMDEPKPQLERQPIEKNAVAATKSNVLQENVPLVPPGYGKPSTHNRNLRRRRKRLAVRNQSSQEPLAPTSGANAIPPVTRTSSAADIELESEPQVRMMSLRNKNKKKNFRQFMDKPLPAKIVFTELENAPVQLLTSEPPDKPTAAGICTSAKVSITPIKHARLIPPSERDDLPSNIFVTSIDVEEGMRPKKKRRSKEEKLSYDDESCTADFSLDYDSAEVSGPVASTDETQLHLHAEQQWNLLAKITDMSQVQGDSIVAYKALAINPTTFTPDILMTVARVTCISSTQVTTRPLRRPTQVSFGGLTEETEVDEEDETCAWADVIASDWRVVR